MPPILNLLKRSKTNQPDGHVPGIRSAGSFQQEEEEEEEGFREKSSVAEGRKVAVRKESFVGRTVLRAFLEKKNL